MATTAETTREERIETQLKGLPAKPGVYLFRDASGRAVAGVSSGTGSRPSPIQDQDSIRDRLQIANLSGL